MIRKIERRGQRVLVIDIRYEKPDASEGRERHDAQVQTMAAATAEERRASRPAHVVQKLAGHRNLSTIQHDVHFREADLEDAARRLDDEPAAG